MRDPQPGVGGRYSRGHLRGVVRVLALPAMWASNDPETLVSTLVEGPLDMLRLEFFCLRLHSPFDGIRAETSRVCGRADPELDHQLSRAVDGWLSVPSQGRRVVPNPFGPGRVTIVCLRLGIREARGTLVVGARRAGFPTRAEGVLLQVAVNQVVIGLDEVRRSAELEHGRAEDVRVERERLELASLVEHSGHFIDLASSAGRCRFVNVAGQTLVGLSSDDDVLGRDITERKEADGELSALRDEPATELNAMIRLHEFSTRQHSTGELPVLLGEVLSANMASQNADFGSVQLYESAGRALRIVAQSGFEDSFLEQVRRTDAASAIGQSSVHDSRIIIEDVMLDERFAPHRAIAEAAGFRAVQSTPLFSSAGQPLGVLSTYFRRPRRPSEWDLRFTDLYARLAAEAIEREQAQAALRRSELHLAEAERDLARVGRAMTMGQSTATITHEMSQSLAAVALGADASLRWLAAHPPNLAEVEASVIRIGRDAHRANEVLTRIRSFLAGSKSQKTTLSAGDILPDVVGLIQGKARANGVQLFVSASKDLPTFSGDRIQLQQVLVNLASNAIEAMHSVTGRLRRLDIGVAQHGAAELRFAVRDSGPGLDSTQRHRVFDAFYTTKERGMGMGLAICRSIVEAHGGRLWADPNPGPGETFQFTLPLFAAGA